MSTLYIVTLFNFLQSTSGEMLGWKKHKLESRLLGEISVTSDMQMTPPLWQKVKHVTTDWFQIEKGVHQGCILSPCLFNLYAEYIMRNPGLEEAQAGIKIARGISIASGMQMTPHSWQKVKRN